MLRQDSESDPWRVMPAIVTDVRTETPGVLTYNLALQNEGEAEQFSVRPGQFNMLYVPGVGEAAISVSGDPNQCPPIVHTVRAVGNVTHSLARSRIGTTLGIRGPFGSRWPVDACLGKDVVLVAGGIGLAPLRSVVYDMMARRDRFESISVLIGARSPADLLYADEYDTWQRGGINVETTVDRADMYIAEGGWHGNIGVVTLLLQRLAISEPKRSVLFTCGPEVMMMYAIQTAMQRGIERSGIWLSLERNMNCAIGHCGHCQLGPHFICKDGPILRYDDVAKLMDVEAL